MIAKPEESKGPLFCSTYIMVMFEETDGTARNLTASQKISSPRQIHSAGTAAATARKQECGYGTLGGWCDGTGRKEIWCKRTVGTKTDVPGGLKVKLRHTFLCN